jgi:hypothetical protein
VHFKIEVHEPVGDLNPMDLAMLRACMLRAADPNLGTSKSVMDLKQMTADEIAGDVPPSSSTFSFDPAAGFPGSYSTGRLPNATAALADLDSCGRGIIKSWTMDQWDRSGVTNWSFDSNLLPTAAVAPGPR